MREDGPVRKPIYFYTHLPVGFETVAARLEASPRLWLPHPVSEDAEGYVVTLRTGDRSNLPEVAASVTVGESLRDARGAWLVRRIGWKAMKAGAVFPVLAGDLELAAVGPEVSQLTLIGTYRPPISVLGEVGDRLVGHHVAEAVVRRFVLDVATALEARESTLPT